MLASVPGLDPAPLIEALGDESPSAAIDALAGMGDRAVPSLVRALGTGADRVRDGAASALAAMGPPAWPAVAPLLHDPSRRTRLAAARSLSGSGWTPPDMREAVAFRSALGDWDAVAAMGGAAVPHLAIALRDRHPAAREEVARALGRSADPGAVAPLAGLLGHDPEDEVREAAAVALGILGDLAAVPALRTALEDRSAAVRLASASALQDLGWQPASEDDRAALLVATGQWSALGVLGAASAPRLVRALGDDSYGARRGAGAALIALGAAARPALERAREDPDPAVRDGAAALLARMGPAPQAVEEVLLESGPASEPGPEPAAVHEVPSADLDRPAVAYLAGRLYAGAAEERLDAAAALAAMPADLAVPALAGAAADPDTALRAAAVAALSALGTPGAMDLLAGRLADSDPGLRGAAARALASAGPTAVPALVAALSWSGRDARAAAAAVLARGAYAPPGAPEGAALAIALEDWRGAARFGEDAVEPLGALLGHPDPDLRLGAVVALGEIGGARAVALLRTVGADPSRAVRDRAELQLQLLGSSGG